MTTAATTQRRAAKTRVTKAMPEPSVVALEGGERGDSSPSCPRTHETVGLKCTFNEDHVGYHFDATRDLFWCSKREGDIAFVQLVNTVFHQVMQEVANRVDNG